MEPLKNKQLKIKEFMRKITINKILKKLNDENHKFQSFYTDDREIKFSLKPLQDNRGIGRVAKEHFSYMYQNLSLKKGTKEIKDTIHFYSSIHWCPTILPPKSIVMIHDVIPMLFPEIFKEVATEWKTKFYPIAQQAEHIITISQTSKNDIIKYLNIPKDKITIVNNGVTALTPAQKIDFKLPKEYFVYLGSYDVHKNLNIILDALTTPQCSNYNLVMIGDNFQAMKRTNELNLNERVFFLGKLDDEEMAFVIQNSTSLLFPSLYEGFGLPPMEAALLKVPSICSTRPTMSEFLYDVSLFAEPDKVDEWATHMKRLSTDLNSREDLAKKALTKVSTFTWEKSSKKLLDTLSKKRFPIRILIDVQAMQSASRRGGIGRYAYNLLEAMIKNNKEHEISVLINDDLSMDNYDNLTSLLPNENIYHFSPKGDTRESIEENHTRAKLSKIEKEKIVLDINPDMFLIMSLFEGLDESVVTSVGEVFPSERTAVILYDLIPFVEQKKYLHKALPKKHYMSKIEYLKKANLLLSISQFSKDEAIEQLHLSPDKIVNISSAIDAKFIQKDVSSSIQNELYGRVGIEKKFIMFTGSYDLRKNQKMLIEAYSKMDKKLQEQYQLVIVGNGRKELIESVKEFTRDLNLSKNSVLFLEHLNDEDLLNLYNLSSLFVFPSFREGFGLPVLEAMSCGLPTIGSNTTSIPEVINFEEALFNPNDVDSIVSKIEEVLTHKDFAKRLVSHGLKQSKSFSWDNSAKITLNALEQSHRDLNISTYEEEKPKREFKLFVKKIPIVGWFTRWSYNLLRLNNLKHSTFILQEQFIKLEKASILLKEELYRAEENSKLLKEQLKEQSSLFELKLFQSHKEIALISTWNTRCGIASYSKELIKEFKNDVVIFAPYANQEELVSKDTRAVCRSWNQSDDTLENLFHQVTMMGFKKLFIQFNYGLFNLKYLNSFIKKSTEEGIEVYITLHSTTDDIFREEKKLIFLKEGLTQSAKLFVHTQKDIETLKKLDIVERVTLFEQGIIDIEPPKRYATDSKTFKLATYGFFLQSKGLIEMIKAFHLLKNKKNINISLLMQNAKYNDHASTPLIEEAKKLVAQYQLEESIIIDTQYLSDKETIERLGDVDLIVFPYQKTGESSSAAVRTAIASKRYIAVTPQPIFDEVSDFVFKFKGDSIEEIAKGIENAMVEIVANSKNTKIKKELQSKWIEAHRYSKLSQQLKGILLT